MIKVKVFVDNTIKAYTPLQYSSKLNKIGIYTPDKRFETNDKLIRVRTGIRIQFPPGYFGLMSLDDNLLATNVLVLASPSILDWNDSTELVISIINVMGAKISLGGGTRVAQLLILPYEPTEILEVTSLREIRGF